MEKLFFSATCPDCGMWCNVVPRDDSFDYSGTHCTHGKSGTHYGQDHGVPESECCGALIEDAVEIPLEA